VAVGARRERTVVGLADAEVGAGVDELVALLVLLPAAGSGVVELTVAVLVMDCGSTSLASSTVRVTVVSEPSVMAVAWVQVNWSPDSVLHVHPVPVAVVPDGSVSPVAVCP